MPFPVSVRHTVRRPSGTAGRPRVRRLAPADLNGLRALYRSLSDRDRYQRFFTEAPPDRAIERYVTLLGERGFGVVATDDADRIVGEAGYLLLAEGDAEFGITVAADWRGLGHTLLDTITDHAAQAGVPSLQADVLADNQAMRSLAAKRGYALIHSADYTVLRITMGTAAPVPSWPSGTPHPRLLVETPAWRWRGASQADAAGFHVVSCPGPSSFRNGHCPPLHGQPCPLVDGADAVVVALSPDDRNRGALTPIHRFCHADVPVFLQEVAGEGPPAWLPGGLPTFPATASPDEIVEALQAAVKL